MWVYLLMLSHAFAALLLPPSQERAKQILKPEMLRQVEQFYFGHYVQHFTDPAWAAGLASIPYIFVWDDHDIFDGWGSYPEYLQNCPVFQVGWVCL